MNRRTNIIITGILAVASLLIGAALHNVYNAKIDNTRRLEQQNERNSAVSNEDLMTELKKLTKKLKTMKESNKAMVKEVKSVKDELKTMKESNKAMAKDVSTAKDIALAFDTCWDRVCPTEGPTSSTPTTSPTRPTSSPTTEGPTSSTPTTSPTTSSPTSSPTTEGPTSSPTSITKEILEEFNWSTNGHLWQKYDGWMTETPYCEWYGIYCANGKVGVIFLTGNNLKGEINESIGGLTDLQELDLSNNEIIPFPETGITGTLPKSLGSLTNLQKLYLDGNQMSGVIPDVFSDLTELKELRLHNNGFTGSVPQSICDLKENHDLYGIYIDDTVSCQCCG